LNVLSRCETQIAKENYLVLYERRAKPFAQLGEAQREAFLLHGDDVFLASDGEIVQRRYKVISISANSILVEDMANNNRQTLPLLGR